MHEKSDLKYFLIAHLTIPILVFIYQLECNFDFCDFFKVFSFFASSEEFVQPVQSLFRETVHKKTQHINCNTKGAAIAREKLNRIIKRKRINYICYTTIKNRRCEINTDKTTIHRPPKIEYNNSEKLLSINISYLNL